jgi:CubicO group peptidase (beta-lactamase class C family)
MGSARPMRHNVLLQSGIFHMPMTIAYPPDEVAPEAAGFSASRLRRLPETLASDVASGAIPGAVIWIARRGHLACFQACGFAERATQRVMQKDSIFRIASMTKPITVTAALLLMEEGKLSLGDPVSRYIPELRDLQVGVAIRDTAGEVKLRYEPAARPISIQDLMRHTAGFTYGDFGDSLVQREYRRANLMEPLQSNAEMVQKLAKMPLAYQPGTTFEYGMSTDVLGRVIEVVAAMRLDRFFEERVTAPLGMIDTAFSAPAASKQRFAVPQRRVAPPRPAAAPAAAASEPVRLAKWCSAGGGLSSTAADYSRFCQMLLNGGELDGLRFLSRKSIELMTHNHLPPGLNFGDGAEELGQAAPLPKFGQGYGLGVGVRLAAGLSTVPGSVGDFYWSGITGPTFWIDPREQLIVVFMLQELNMERRARYRSLLRALVYQALE